MANEFVARRGIIAQSGGAKITGSLLVSGVIDASGYSVTAQAFTGSFSGSIGTATSASYVTWTNVDNKPAGLVSSSAQYPGWVTASSQIDYNQIQNKLSGVVSSSTQVQPLLPGGTVSSSAQYPGWVTASSQINVTQVSGYATLATTGSNTFVGNQIISGSLTTTADTMNFNGSMAVSGTLSITGSVNNINGGFTGSFSGSHTGTFPYASLTGIPSGIISSSTQLPAGTVSSSGQVKDLLPTDTVSSSAQVVANLVGQTIAPSIVNATTITATTISGSTISGSFVGDGSQLTGIVTTLSVTGSDNSKDDINLKTEGLSFAGGNGVTATVASNTVTVSIPAGVLSSSTQVVNALPTNTVSSSTQVVAFLPTGTVSSSAQYPGWVTASSQVDITSTNGYSSFSSSLATIDQNQQSQLDALMDKTGSYAVTASNNFTGVQTITNTTNSTNYTDGALVVQGGVGIAKDVNISGSLTVTGLLTAVTMSTQYVTSSQYVVGTSRVIVNDDDLVRFAGLSVIDSGSTSATGSLLWDSLKNHWIYEREDGGAYKSSIVIAGPKNYGSLGNEEELVAGRIPVATGGDHIDSNYASSSLRIDFDTKETHVEAGLYITGSVTASVGFKGDGSQLTGIATTLAITGSDNTKDDINLKTSGLTFAGGNGITTTVASDTVTISAPAGTVSSSGQVKDLLPTDTVSSSAQVTAFLPADSVSSSTQVAAFLPGGTVSSSAQYPGWVTASSQVQLNQITGTTFAAADFTFPQKLTVSGVATASVAANISNNLYSGSILTNIIGAVSNQVVATLPSSYDGVFFDYVVKDGTNYRTGTVMVTANSTNVEFTDVSTNDIGNTVDEVFTVDIVGGLIRLKFSSGTGTWTVKTIVRAL